MIKKRKSAIELRNTRPGVFERYRAIVLALCQGYFVGGNDGFTKAEATKAGGVIVAVADAIIEATEQ